MREAIEIAAEGDVLMARERGARLAERLGFAPGEQAAIATAISEIASNILRYAGRGGIVLEPLPAEGWQGIRVTATDQGPGIADLALAMQDGYSTGGGLGLGLPGARRLMDEFEIVSRPDAGTTVSMVKWPSRRPPSV